MTDTESPQIQALKERYKASIPDKIELIREHVELVLAEPADSNFIDEAHQILHKLAGSSGMYGYDDVNVLCRDAMSRLDVNNIEGSVEALNKVVELLEQYS